MVAGGTGEAPSSVAGSVAGGLGPELGAAPSGAPIVPCAGADSSASVWEGLPFCSALAVSMGRGAYHRNGRGPGETFRYLPGVIGTVVTPLQATMALLPSLVQVI